VRVQTVPRLVRCLVRALRDQQTSDFFLQQVSCLPDEPVIREDFVLDLTRGRRVLHIGFLDSPFTEANAARGELLHQRITGVASFLYGVDVDADALQVYRRLTGDDANCILDIEKRDQQLSGLGLGFDVILLLEVLEHLHSPAEALQNLRELCLMNPGALACVSAPNAFSAQVFAHAIRGTELVHPDHRYYFSPFTLRKLIEDCGFADVSLRLYASQSFMDCPGITKHGLIATCSPRGVGI